MTTVNTGSKFFNLNKDTGKYVGSDGVGTLSMAADDKLEIEVGAFKATVEPKFNSYGKYYISTLGGPERYFISERQNAKGKYVIAKVAVDRPADQRSQGPASYGARA